jgi:hypothetical protein
VGDIKSLIAQANLPRTKVLNRTKQTFPPILLVAFHSFWISDMGLYVVVLFSGGVVVLVLLLFESRLLSLLGGGGCGTLNDFFSSTDISGGFVIIGVCLLFVEAMSEDII